MIAIGNGESRKHIKVDQLDGPKVGCNAIMRDYKMDYLVCVDRRMMDEAIRRKANDYSLVYTRPEWYSSYQTLKRTRLVPNLPYVSNEKVDLPFHWGAGPYAVLISATYTRIKEVSMIGFDLYGNEDKVNNVYKDTPNYDSSEKRAVDPSFWIHQIGMVFQCFPNVHFKIYQEDKWQLPKAWNYPNVLVDKISNISYNT